MMLRSMGISESSSLDFSLEFGDVNCSDRTLLLELVNDTDPLPLISAPRGKVIHITSLVLAARSPFFRKLFSNGMRESEEKYITIRIKALEEVSFMDLLNYIYTSNLPTSLNALLDLVVIADKFEVVSCLRDSIQSLRTLSMTCESASLYLDLPQCVLMSPTVQPLIDVATQFLVSYYKDFHRFKVELLNLPLACVQAVVSSDDLRPISEYEVYDFVLTWVNNHYSNMEERREILKTHFLHLIRFPYMTTKELTEKVQTCSYIDLEVASKIVNCALIFKADRKQCLAAEEENTAFRQFVERAYRVRPVKMIEFEVPHQQCIVYLDLKREEVMEVFPLGVIIMSQTFHLGEQQLFLGATTLSVLAQGTNPRFFVLSMEVLGSTENQIKYDIALRKKPFNDFRCLATGRHNFTMQSPVEVLLYVPWSGFIEDDSPYFINDILHLRVDLIINK